MATDFLGQNLNIGDDVIFLNYNRTSADLERGKITKVFPHTAEIGRKRRAEHKIVKILTNVVPVVHGRWMHEETEGGFHIWRCSRCGRGMNNNPEGIDLYCYHCGAKMDGGAENG